MFNPKMSQIFYCHQEQWIQYFATARNIPEHMVTYVPTGNNMKLVIKNAVAHTDFLERQRYKNFIINNHPYPNPTNMGMGSVVKF